MTKEYASWLAEVYQTRTGVELDSTAVGTAVAILARHAARWPGHDLIPLAAAEAAERMAAGQPFPPFLELVDRSADAVRHRIARAAKQHAGSAPPGMLEQTQEPSGRALVSEQAVAAVVAANLTLEEQTVLALFLDGVPHEEAAAALGVSPRTIYRKLEEIRRRF